MQYDPKDLRAVARCECGNDRLIQTMAINAEAVPRGHDATMMWCPACGTMQQLRQHQAGADPEWTRMEYSGAHEAWIGVPR